MAAGTVYEKNGVKRIASSPTEQVQLHNDGWTVAKSQKAAQSTPAPEPTVSKAADK